MRAKNIVITGASDGIGAAAARQLSRDGHNLFLTGRSPEKTAAVAEEVGAPYFVADFAHLDQVRSLAEAILDHFPVIDVLANNAGLMGPAHRTVTDDGHELTNQVNYLSLFLLDHLLFERLRASRATVVATSSMAHWWGRPNLADPDLTRSYSAWLAYGTSKLNIILHTRELQRRGGGDINAVSFHPGVVVSNFSSESGSLIGMVYHAPFAKALLTSPDKGADTLVFAAEGTPGVDFTPGEYLVNRRTAASRACGRDIKLADALWRHTEGWLGLDS